MYLLDFYMSCKTMTSERQLNQKILTRKAMLRSVFINLIAVFVDFDVCSTSRIYLYTRETYFRIFNPNIISRNLFGFIHQLFSPYWSIYMVRYTCSLPLLKQSVHCAPNYILNIQRIAFENVSRILGNSCETMVN